MEKYKSFGSLHIAENKGLCYHCFMRIIQQFMLLFCCLCGYSYAAISDYQATFIPGIYQDHLHIAIRTFDRDNSPFFLLVNPHTFDTTVIPASHFAARKQETSYPISRYFSWKKMASTPYIKALMTYTDSPWIFPQFSNQGLTHAEHPTEGMFLTIDMCPSVNTFEQDFFESLSLLSAQKNKPIPVGIAISGAWLLQHEHAFNYLVSLDRQDQLNITWINHSFSHVHYHDLPDKENFLLSPFTNISLEILGLEKLLLDKGITPSVFFRFPGLISNESLMLTLRQFGLIPIGTDTWVGLGQEIKPGSLILVHGNGNVPQEMTFLQPFLQRNDIEWLPVNQLF